MASFFFTNWYFLFFLFLLKFVILKSGLKNLSIESLFKCFKVFIGLLFFQFPTQSIFSQNIRLVNDFPSVFLKEQIGKSGLVVIFSNPECPRCQKYKGVLKNIHGQFKVDGQINFIGFFAGMIYSEASILQYVRKNKIDFSVFKDLNFYSIDFLKATLTPEVYILDSSLNVKWKGLIDNWFFSLGRRRGQPTEFYLNDNLDSLIVGSPFLYHSSNDIVGFIK